MSQMKEESNVQHLYDIALTHCKADVFRIQESKNINIITKYFEVLQDTVDIQLCV
jgi:hypothetical protein